MSEAAVAPAESVPAAAPPATPEESTLTPFEGDGIDALFSRLRAKYGEDPGASAADEGAPATDTPPEQPTETPPPATAPAEPPPAPPAEPAPLPAAAAPEPKQSRLQLEHARLLAANEAATADVIEHKKRADTAMAELAQLKAQAKKNPLKVMELLYGEPLPKIIERGKAGEFDKPELEMPPEVREAVEYAKTAKEREAADAAKAKRQQQFQADLPKIQRFLTDFAKDYPIASLTPDAAPSILSALYDRLDAYDRLEPAQKARTKAPTLKDVARELEATVAENTGSMFLDTKLVKHWARDPKVREAWLADAELRADLLQALKVTEQKTASTSSAQGVPVATTPNAQPAAPPTSVANINEVPERIDRELSDEEERLERVKRFRQAKANGLFQP